MLSHMPYQQTYALDRYCRGCNQTTLHCYSYARKSLLEKHIPVNTAEITAVIRSKTRTLNHFTELRAYVLLVE
jgi:hypothetical protein